MEPRVSYTYKTCALIHVPHLLLLKQFCWTLCISKRQKKTMESAFEVWSMCHLFRCHCNDEYWYLLAKLNSSSNLIKVFQVKTQTVQFSLCSRFLGKHILFHGLLLKCFCASVNQALSWAGNQNCEAGAPADVPALHSQTLHCQRYHGQRKGRKGKENTPSELLTL